MLSVRDDSVISAPTISGPSTSTWFYLSVEFLVGLGISGFLLFLSVVKSFLPEPPRDLTGDVVLVTGATSNLGGMLAEEFARGGCSVICVDSEDSPVEETASRLSSRFPAARIERIGYRHIQQDQQQEQQLQRRGGSNKDQEADEVRSPGRRSSRSCCAYSCDLWDREQIKALAKRVKEDVGRVDVLVTCAGSPGQGVFDTVSRTLMSHYWTVLAFLPSMLHRERAHVIGITPTLSTEDAYMGSKAAVAGLMESLGQQFSGRNNRLTFMTVAPKAEPSLLKQSEREIAKEVVRAVQRDLPCLSMSWSSKFIYHMSCRLYGGITKITRWLDT